MSADLGLPDFGRDADTSAQRVLWLAGMTSVAVVLLAVTSVIYIGGEPDAQRVAEAPQITAPPQPQEDVSVAAVAIAPRVDPTVVAEPVDAPDADVIAITDPDVCTRDLHALAKLSTLYFESGSVLLDRDSLQTARQMAEATRRCPAMRLQVWGHADGSGDDRTNLALSKQRADNTLRALAAMGFDTTTIRAIGAGASLPLAQGDTDDSLDRRVEFRVVPSQD